MEKTRPPELVSNPDHLPRKPTLCPQYISRHFVPHPIFPPEKSLVNFLTRVHTVTLSPVDTGSAQVGFFPQARVYKGEPPEPPFLCILTRAHWVRTVVISVLVNEYDDYLFMSLDLARELVREAHARRRGLPYRWRGVPIEEPLYFRLPETEQNELRRLLVTGRILHQVIRGQPRRKNRPYIEPVHKAAKVWFPKPRRCGTRAKRLGN
ncbi:hypothetical protein EGW08_022793 [Elysia chlorotica]|uniref:Uncharacterized protein n=1 Tax=Elysia chlorotica TaxID=188477 RepID=A0A3S0Z4W0_ELYCH|nr:hypothetical protein EGW08_022793 [Elysia chlorotica]